MRVVVLGATGMVGQGVLLEALDDPEVSQVLAIGRRPTGMKHPKLVDAVHEDFADFGPLAEKLAGYDACFDCMGVTSVGLSEKDYAHVTYDFAISAAEAMLAANPRSVFIYVSGAGTDSTEKGRAMWARVKGRTENKLLAMGFGAAYMLRPGFIRPERGIRSRTRLYRAFYAALAPFGGLISRMAPGAVTTTTFMGQAMLELAAARPADRIVDTRRINELAARRQGRAR